MWEEKAMSEFSDSRDSSLNKYSVPEGRTRPVKGSTDGEYDALDLQDVHPGGVLTVVTQNGAHQFIKTREEPGVSNREGWMRTTAEQTLGVAVRLTLLDPNSSGGTPFLTRGIVVRRGLEMGVTSFESHPDTPQLRSLGGIGIITYKQHETIEDAFRTLRLKDGEISF
jgi:hypothetical protein